MALRSWTSDCTRLGPEEALRCSSPVSQPHDSRVDTLLGIRRIARGYGGLQELIAQNFRAEAAAFEGLLEKSAAERKKEAGQYFTPRPLLRSIVRLMKQDPRGHKQVTIMDPACGTGGFIVEEYQWLDKQSHGAYDRATARRVKTATYYGEELVARPRRLALMNLYLHARDGQRPTS